MCPTNFCSVQPVATPGRVLSALPKCRHPSTHKNAACISIMQDYCFIKHPVTGLRESAPGGSRGPRPRADRRPASAAMRGAARAALRRYDCPDPAIDMWEPRRRARRASPVDRRTTTSLSHELQRPCGPKRHKPFSRNSENMPILAIQGVAVKEKRRAFQLHGAARLRRPPRALRVLPSG